MTTSDIGRLVLLAGPSCVGKTPLEKALARYYPELRRKLQKIVLFNSRSPRPSEADGVDYHFRSRGRLEKMALDPRFIALEVRGDLQVLDIEEIRNLLRQGDVFYEGNTFIARLLQDRQEFRGVKKLSVFLSPLSADEVEQFTGDKEDIDFPDLIRDIMRRKLLRRMKAQKKLLSFVDLQEIERRASDVYAELKETRHFEYVIPNHDGEDSENWTAFNHPIGDARKAIHAFARLLEGSSEEYVENWGELKLR